MSLRLLEDGTVVATLLPEPVDRDDVVLRLVDRKNGLILLRSSLPLSEHFGNRVRTRLKGVDPVA